MLVTIFVTPVFVTFNAASFIRYAQQNNGQRKRLLEKIFMTKHYFVKKNFRRWKEVKSFTVLDIDGKDIQRGFFLNLEDQCCIFLKAIIHARVEETLN